MLFICDIIIVNFKLIKKIVFSAAWRRLWGFDLIHAFIMKNTLSLKYL